MTARFVGAAAVWVVGAGISCLDGRLVVSFPVSLMAGLVAALLLGNLADRALGRAGLLLALGGAATIVANDPLHDAGEFLAIPTLVTVAWLAGLVIRERSESADAAEARAELLAREREAREHIAVAEERTRIARELHDVLGHALSVTVLQVGGVRRRIAEACPAEAESLAATERAAAEALAEIRVLVTKMRKASAGGPEARPGLARLDSVLAQVRAAGLEVDVRTKGRRRPLPEAVDVVAIRVVQEGLTNVLRHARAEHAEVLIEFEERELALTISDDGRGRTPSACPDSQVPSGNGLRGLGERVELLGGELDAAPGADGGFRLQARVPLPVEPPALVAPPFARPWRPRRRRAPALGHE